MSDTSASEPPHRHDPLERQLELTAVREGAMPEESVLALWWLRNVALLDDLDAYEFLLFDESTGVDAYWIRPGTTEEPPTVVLVEAKRPSSGVLSVEIERFVRQWLPATQGGDATSLLPEAVRTKLTPRRGTRRPTPLPSVQLAFVTDQELTEEARDMTGRLAQTYPGTLEVFDATELREVARAIEGPSFLDFKDEVSVRGDEALELRLPLGDVVVCPVDAASILRWPGVEDRRLFDLNIRYALGRGRVRDSLDAALRATAEHDNFPAFHNGLTVLCTQLRLNRKEERLSFEGLSVVNGAQTVLAIHANAEYVKDSDLRLLVKFVAVDPASPSAREVAVRSNTQNPVTTRNLRALDARQLEIQRDFVLTYGGRYRYETRPDIEHPPDDWTIPNDYAAQLICAVYNEQPWLAVKRDSLFSAEVYPTIFRQHIGAPEVSLCHLIRRAVQTVRDEVPDTYARRSWRLTALVTVYLVGQILRTADDPRVWLDRPREMLTSEERIDAFLRMLGPLASSAASTLRMHHEALRDAGLPDEFRVDFKQQKFLRTLAATARQRFVA